MSLLSPEDANTVSQIRLRAAEGTATLDDYKKAIIILRMNRKAATVAASESRASGGSRSKKPQRSSDELLNELEGL